MNKLDRYIFYRLSVITFFVLAVLVCIFILVDFSENSDDFVDKGATLAQIWGLYYLNYIPEMFRLVIPLAVLVACLFLTVQMTERLEIIALKASGVSIYRLLLPYMVFGIGIAAIVSYLDAYVIPVSNAERITFEREYISGSSDRLDRGGIFRQDSDSSVVTIRFYDPNSHTGHTVNHITYKDEQIKRVTFANRIRWVDSTSVWQADRIVFQDFDQIQFTEIEYRQHPFEMNLLPQDFARRSSDIYQLTYPQALQYIESVKRIGAAGVTLPQVQLYGRMAYPFSIIIVCLIGFALATERRKGGKGVYIAGGLAISFIYLSMMKVIEPFGIAGTVSPIFAATFPHLFFLAIGLLMIYLAKK